MSHFSCVRGPVETCCSPFLGALTHCDVMDVSKKKVPDFQEVREEVSENESGKLSVGRGWNLFLHYLSTLSRLGSPPRWVGVEGGDGPLGPNEHSAWTATVPVPVPVSACLSLHVLVVCLQIWTLFCTEPHAALCASVGGASR